MSDSRNLYQYITMCGLMSEIPIAQTSEGTEILLSGRIGKTSRMSIFTGKAGIAIVIAVIGSVIGFFLLEDPLYLVTAPVVIVIALIINRVSSAVVSNPIIDTENNKLRGKDGNWHNYDQTSEIVLHRLFEKRSSFRSKSTKSSYSESNKVNYLTHWRVLLRMAGQDTILIEFSQQADNIDMLLTSTGGKFVQVSEQIAELCQLSLVDATGLEPIKREAGQTDLSLKEYLTQQGDIPQYDGTIPDVVNAEFEVSGGDGSYKIRDRDLNLNYIYLFFVIPLGFFVAGIAYIIYISIGNLTGFALGVVVVTLGFFELLFLWLFLLLANSIRSYNSIFINLDRVLFVQKGLFTKSLSKEMSLSELEKIVTFQIDDVFGLELVSDKERIPLTGKFDEQEVVVLKKLVEQLIVSL